jgi:hypothetical protein
MAKTRHLCMRCAPGASRTVKADAAAAKKKATKTRTRKTRTTRRADP